MPTSSGIHNKRVLWGCLSLFYTQVTETHKGYVMAGNHSAGIWQGHLSTDRRPCPCHLGAGSSPSKMNLSQCPSNSVLSIQGIRNVVNLQNFDWYTAS